MTWFCLFMQRTLVISTYKGVADVNIRKWFYLRITFTINLLNFHSKKYGIPFGCRNNQKDDYVTVSILWFQTFETFFPRALTKVFSYIRRREWEERESEKREGERSKSFIKSFICPVPLSFFLSVSRTLRKWTQMVYTFWIV